MTSVCVHGLGYVGLPTAAMLARAGQEVAGYDADPEVRRRLRDGMVDLDEPGLAEFVAEARASGRLQITDRATTAAYHVICVPTPIDDASKQPNLEYVRAAGESVADALQAGDTVVLESTVPPTTTVDVLAPILERSDLEAGEEFGLAHAPETVLPGAVIAELRENDRIVGGIDDRSVAAAVRLYESFTEGAIRTVRTPTLAEFAKLIQNTYRDVNIGFANEIAKIAADYDVDSREAIALANSHPRVDVLQPGPGVGGHCIPIDPWFLATGSDGLDLVEAARRVNDSMPAFVVDLLRAELGTLGGRKIAILGVAYKGNVGDTRMSPGLQLARSLDPIEAERQTAAADGGSIEPIDIALHDPHVRDPALDLTDLEAATAGADAVVIATDHDEFEHIELDGLHDRMAGTVVIDTKGILNPTRWRESGFDVSRV